MNLNPQIFNFTIENSQLTRVYFDSSKIIQVGLNGYIGFTISEKTITGITIQSGLTTGHYFTVSAAFNFWDNNTIRYEGGSDLEDLDSNPLFDFTKEYIVNNITNPTEGANGIYYVDGSVGSSGNGLTEGTAFKTLQEGINKTNGAGGGIKIWVKAGVTYSEGALNDGENGSATNPNVIEGYKNTIGDLDGVMYYSITPNSAYPSLDNTEMPLFDGGNRAGSATFYAFGSDDYYIWRNIQVTKYKIAFQCTNGASNFHWDNIIIKDIGDLTANTGHGIRLNGSNSDFYRGRILNSQIINVTSECINIGGNNTLINNCKNYCNEAPAGSGDTNATTDYYYLLAGSENIILNSLAYKDTPNGYGHNGHGFSMKTNSATSPVENNLVNNCEAVGIYDSFEVRHLGTKYNSIKNSIARADIPNRAPQTERTGGISFYSGGSFNTFENMNIHDVDCGTIWLANSEADTDVNIQQNSIIRNSLFKDINMFARCNHIETSGTSSPSGNKLYNNTILNCPILFKIYNNNAFVFGVNDFKNNIFDTIPTQDSNESSAGWVYDYTNIWNSWTNSIGTNSINVDPQFSPFPKSTNDALNAGIWIEGNEYDIEGNQRSNPPTIGSVQILVNSDGSVTLTWTNSDTVGVTETVVYRDDVEVARILVANPSEYIDTTIVSGNTYKYEVQAVDSNGESVQEVDGVNVTYMTIGTVTFEYNLAFYMTQ